MRHKFDCLDAKAPVLGKYFLEASAGTGKTFAIQHLFVKLLLNSLPFNQILVVTFTKAATRELKARIYQTLKNTLELLKKRDLENAPSYLAHLLEKEEEHIKEAIYTLEEALKGIDEASLFTIHGFCFRALKEFQALIDDYRPYRDPDEENPTLALRSEVLDGFRRGLPLEIALPFQLALLIKDSQGSLKKLADKVVSLSKEAHEIEAMPENPVLCEKIMQGIRKLQASYPKECADLHGLLQSAAPYFSKITSKEGEIHAEFAMQMALLSAAFERGAFTQDDLSLLLENEVFLIYMAEEYKKKRPAWPDNLSSNFFQDLYNEVAVPLLLAQEPQHLLLRLAAYFVPKLAAFKEQQDLFLPDDLLVQMHRASANPRFAKALRDKYRAVIVDEFQDTDSLQWEIIHTLFSSADALYLVGDPKQSIYAFRNADLKTYLRARDSVQSSVYLSVNYRSDPQLIEALNTLFLKVNSPALEYHPVEASPLLQLTPLEDDKKSMHFFFKKGEKGRAKNWPPQEVEESSFFPFIAGEIVELNQSQGISLGSIAVLVKDRFQSLRLQRALLSHGISCQIRGGESVAETEAFEFMEVLLSAVLHPKNLNFMKQLLGMRFMGFPHTSLKGGFENPLLGKAFLLLTELEKVLKEEGFARFWALFCESSFHRETTFLQQLLELGLSPYADLRQIVSLIVELGTKDRYLQFFKEMRLEEAQQEEKFKKKGMHLNAAVTVMTTHMSKGLEFEIVFALGVCSRHVAKDQALKIQDEGKTIYFAHDQEDEKCKAALHLRNEEKLRLLYVALTRAKKRVYIPYCLDKGLPPLYDASPLELLFGPLMQGCSTQDFISCLESLGQNISYSDLDSESPTGKSLPELPLAEEHLFTPAHLEFSKIFSRSFSSLVKKEFLKKEEEIDRLSSFNALPSGADTGILLHALLERLLKEGLYYPYKEERLSSFIENFLEGTLLSEHRNLIKEMVSGIFSLQFEEGGRSFSLRETPPEQILCEIEFQFLLNKTELIKGFADVLLKAHGKYYLIDWKTNLLSSYSKEALHQEMLSHEYFFQGAIYAEALKRFLEEMEENFLDAFGGMYYLFLRGLSSSSKGVYFFIPDPIDIYTKRDSKI